MLVKNNLAEDGAVPGLAFELVEGRIRWRTEPVPELAEVLLPNLHNNDRRRLRRAACEWLEEALADGPMPSGEVIKQALSCGISRGTLQRAITDLGIKSHKSGFNGGWEMRWTPRAECRVEPPLARTGGLRIVGAEEWETERQREGATEGQGEGATEGGGQTRRQGDTETRGQGEVAALNSSCASSRKCEEIDVTSCASSAAESPDLARSPDLATAATEGLNHSQGQGDLWSEHCQGPETPTERGGHCQGPETPTERGGYRQGPETPTEPESASCASSAKRGDLALMSCASSEKRGDSAMANCASSEEAKTPDPNPKSKSENPKFAGGDESRAAEEEEPLPHWMERWYKTRKAC